MYKKIISVMSVALVVFLCSSFPVFASSGGVSDIYAQLDYIGPDQDVYTNINLTAGVPYRTPAGSPQYYYNWNFDVLGQVAIFNDKDVDIQFNGNNNQLVRYFITTSNSAATQTDGTEINWRLSDVTYIGGQLNVNAMWQNSRVQFETFTPYASGMAYAITVPAHSNVVCYFKLTFVTNTPMPPAGLTLHNPDFNSSSVTFSASESASTYTTGDFHENYISYIPDIYDTLVDLYINNQAQLSVLQQILASYQANVPASNNLTNQSSQASSTIDSQHQSEGNYFSNSQTAIQDTGIQNFQFNSQELGGLNGLKDDFSAVWTACGSLSRYWITSLTIGLALAIIRHRRMFNSD